MPRALSCAVSSISNAVVINMAPTHAGSKGFSLIRFSLVPKKKKSSRLKTVNAKRAGSRLSVRYMNDFLYTLIAGLLLTYILCI